MAECPRAGNPTNEANCIAARAIVEQVDWPCEVLKNYSDVNFGCRKRAADEFTTKAVFSCEREEEKRSKAIPSKRLSARLHVFLARLGRLQRGESRVYSFLTGKSPRIIRGETSKPNE
jgi:hypothetical protein